MGLLSKKDNINNAKREMNDQKEYPQNPVDKKTNGHTDTLSYRDTRTHL